MRRKKMILETTIALLFISMLTGCASSATKDVTVASTIQDTAPYTPKDVVKDFQYSKQPLLGSKDAPIEIVEFGDYKCPWCKKWSENVLSPVLEKYMEEGKVNFRYINMAFVGPDSQTAAEIGEAVYLQSNDLFWKYHDLVLANQGDHNEEWATEEFLYGLISVEIPELDIDKVKEDIASGKAKKAMDVDKSITHAFGIEHSPTIYVNGKLFDSRYTADELIVQLEKLLGK